MNMELTTTDHKSSWTNIKLLCRFYAPILKLQLLIYPAIAIVMYILGQYATQAGGAVASILGVSIMSTILSIMVYFAPCVLTRRNTRMTELMLPATSVEKTVVMICYFLIIIPALTMGLFQLLGWLGHTLFGWACMLDVAKDLLKDSGADAQLNMASSSIAVAANMIQGAAYILTCLWGVISYRNNRTLMSIVWTVVAMISAGLLSGIYTAVCMLAKVTPAIRQGALDEAPLNDALQDIVSTLYPMIITVGVIYSLFAVWMIWRQFSKRQI